MIYFRLPALLSGALILFAAFMIPAHSPAGESTIVAQSDVEMEHPKSDATEETPPKSDAKEETLRSDVSEEATTNPDLEIEAGSEVGSASEGDLQTETGKGIE